MVCSPASEEKLHTMHDKSLGFTHAIPKSGYNLYNGEAKLYGGINMDNEGINVAGSIDYLAVHVESGDFVMFPDSLLAKGNVGEDQEKQLAPLISHK